MLLGKLLTLIYNNSKNEGTLAKITDLDITFLIKSAIKIFSEQEMLLDLESPITILGILTYITDLT